MLSIARKKNFTRFWQSLFDTAEDGWLLKIKAKRIYCIPPICVQLSSSNSSVIIQQIFGPIVRGNIFTFRTPGYHNL